MSEPPNVELREFLRSRRAQGHPVCRRPALARRRAPRPRPAPRGGRPVGRCQRGLLRPFGTRPYRQRVRVGARRRRSRPAAQPVGTHPPVHPRQTEPRTSARPPCATGRPGLQLVVDSITDLPALVLGRRLDVLASNRLARALYTDFDALPPHFRNMARLIFCTIRSARSVRTGPQRPKASSPTCACTPAAIPTTQRWPNSWASCPCAIPTSVAGGPTTTSTGHLRGKELPPRPRRRPRTRIRGIHPDRRSGADIVGDHSATGISVRGTTESVGELGATDRSGRLNTAPSPRV